jgi:very-short-patch-repair endonuclease
LSGLDSTKFAKQLRKESTDAERLLWSRLRAKQLAGIKFRRQEPFRQYVLDFVCYEKRLVIELDGGQHAENAAKP